MSSPPKERNETRAGHPPAVKAGGMRIVQKHQTAGDSSSDRKEDKDSKEFESCRNPPSPPVPETLPRGDKDFTPAAAQVAHTKPVPSVQKLPPSHHINQHIHQPRK
ncbi:death-associated protein 1 [Silurus meridionalis]|nr:death-associated protein 1 [Silurus meridionalis]